MAGKNSSPRLPLVVGAVLQGCQQLGLSYGQGTRYRPRGGHALLAPPDVVADLPTHRSGWRPSRSNWHRGPADSLTAIMGPCWGEAAKDRAGWLKKTGFAHDATRMWSPLAVLRRRRNRRRLP